MVSRLPEAEPLPQKSGLEGLLLEEVRSRISARDFETWFRQTTCRFHPPSRFVLTAPNRFQRAWLEKNFQELLRTCARNILDAEATFEFLTSGATSGASSGASSGVTSGATSGITSGITARATAGAPAGVSAGVSARSPGSGVPLPPPWLGVLPIDGKARAAASPRGAIPVLGTLARRGAQGSPRSLEALDGLAGVDGLAGIGSLAGTEGTRGVAASPLSSQPPPYEARPERSPGASPDPRERGETPRVDLHPDYTFENFVVGRSNRVAHAAAIAVSDYPGKTYNPLFLHGEPGVGKTHLIHAIGHRIRATTRLRVRCVPAAGFFQDIGEAMSRGWMSRGSVAHEKPGREVEHLPYDVLVIDDLQFLPPAERTQLELLRTFNALLESGRQIIIASRTHPRETPGLQERLASRFQWGLVSCVEPPGFETRVSIVLRKARLRSFELPLDVAELIADRVQDSVRELEGALLRVLSLASFNKSPANLELAKLALRDFGEEEGRTGTITIALILRAVQQHYQIRPRDLVSRSKVRSIVLPRQVGMFLARQLTPLSLEEIGLHFGGRDHTTVLYADARINRLRQSDPRIRADIQALKHRLMAGS